MSFTSPTSTVTDWSIYLMSGLRRNLIQEPQEPQPETSSSQPTQRVLIGDSGKANIPDTITVDKSMMSQPAPATIAITPPGLAHPNLLCLNPPGTEALLKVCNGLVATTEEISPQIIVREVVGSFMDNGYARPLPTQIKLALGVVKTKLSFRERVKAEPISVFNTQARMRPTVISMIWTIVIISKEMELTGGPRSWTLIPRVRPCSELFPFVGLPYDHQGTTQTEQKLDEADILFSHYPLPSSILGPLADLATDINQSTFARYMYARSKNPPQPTDSRERSLLRWWISTSSGNINEFLSKFQYKKSLTSGIDKVTKIQLPAPDARELRIAERFRIVFRREAKRVLGLVMRKS